MRNRGCPTIFVCRAAVAAPPQVPHSRASFKDWQPLLSTIAAQPLSEFVDLVDAVLPFVDSHGAPEYFRLKIMAARGQPRISRVTVPRRGAFNGV